MKYCLPRVEPFTLTGSGIVFPVRIISYPIAGTDWSVAVNMPLCWN